ncbi:MAG: hypothetical protein ACKOCX_02385 [Planctomycetota bacterium]
MRSLASERRIGNDRGRGAEHGDGRALRLVAAAADTHVRPRPAMFRALGHDDPPPAVEISGETFRLHEILKHDSWAATGIYASATRRALCKFNRRQPILGLPMRWLGRKLAAREAAFMERLAGIEGIPVSLGPVSCDGKQLPHAVSRQWIAGHALAIGERVDDRFFPTFRQLLAEVHARGVAHVDLHKRENILVDRQGRPHLIDFQISFALPRARVARLLLGGVLRLLQRCDEYHLLKHEFRHRPEDRGLRAADLARSRPWWIRAHRSVAVPFRHLRRGLLVALGIRAGGGQASSEAFPEIAHRPVDAAAPVRQAAG